MLILGQKGANLDQKGHKMGGPRFFPDCKLQFSKKKNHKISFYTKNQQNSMSSSEDISQNVDFGPKRGKVGPKRAQNGRGEIFSQTVNLYFLKKQDTV